MLKQFSQLLLLCLLTALGTLSAQSNGWQKLYQKTSMGGFPVPSFAWDAAGDRLMIVAGSSPGNSYSRTKGKWSGAGSLGSSYWVQGEAMWYDSKRSRFVLFGGQGANFGSTGAWRRYTWESTGTKWTLRNSSGPSYRRGAAAAYDPDSGRSYLFGGYYRINSYSRYYLSDFWSWSGLFWSQINPKTRPSGRYDSAMAYDSGRKRLVLFGGRYSDSNKAYKYSDTWEYDGKNWNRITLSSYPAARSGHVMAYDPLHKVTVLFGGTGTNGTLLNETWSWDGKAWTKFSPKTIPPSASNQFLYWSPKWKTMVLAHAAFPATRPEFWQWNGKDWARQVEASPPPLNGHAGAYDESRDRYVAFGGRSASLRNETWEWDGTAFRASTPSVSPPARDGATMVYSPASKQVILFGGKKAKSLANDTWVYNGTNWAPALFFKNPTARSEHTMAYDRARKRVLVFGGKDASKDLGDFWSLASASIGYTLINTKTSPPPRHAAAMVYDEARDRLLLFGGRSGSTSLNDFWQYDGKDWQQLKPKTLPSPRFGHSMAYEPYLGRVLLFGGSKTGSINTQDAWIYDGTDWQPAPTTGTRPSTRSDSVLVFDTKRKQFLLHDGSFRADLWSFKMNPTQAGLTPFGSGCGSPAVTLASAAGSIPLIGSTFQVQISNAPSNSAFGVLALGASRTQFGPFTLPLKLDGLGLKGCSLYQSQDLIFPFLVQSTRGKASIPIPRITSLIGLTTFAQAFVKAPKANPHDVWLSNGGVLVIGNR